MTSNNPIARKARSNNHGALMAGGQPVGATAVIEVNKKED
ncbi:hypothetical protein KIS1582_2368 [Cytobacillus firmus]|uniref:Uncharacterized protein n=1 Tax=Cytobacillus firmus TaxID=1399 RepID=A0A800NAB6_CYTFI|nr:hypothetical protein KIS1582_2368 [Cytobacillus firmus]